MKEADLWRKLRDGTSSLGIHWVRLESWASPGIPDVNGFYDSYDLWIELKVMRSSTIKIDHTKYLGITVVNEQVGRHLY